MVGQSDWLPIMIATGFADRIVRRRHAMMSGVSWSSTNEILSLRMSLRFFSR
jgi:hypothetical protein